MDRITEGDNIPSYELSALSILVRAHRGIHGDRLRALIAFGPLVQRGDGHDIHALEIIEGWKGVRDAEFGNTAELPLRGLLRLYILTPGEFEHPETITDEAQAAWTKLVLEQMDEGYSIVYQNPYGYAARVLAVRYGTSELIIPPYRPGDVSIATWHDPLQLPPVEQVTE